MKHGARWIVAATVVLAIGIACGPSLPSAEPLGRGPMAEPEPSLEEQSPRPADRDAGADAGADADPGEATDGGDRTSDAPSGPGSDAGPPDDSGATDDREAADASADADGDVDTAAIDFAGDYRGDDVSTIRIEGLPDRTERDPNARTKVAQPAADRIEITLVNSANGDPLCTIQGQVTGNRAEVDPGQSCFSEGSALTGSVTSGHARLEGDRLTLDLDVELELTVGPESRSGRIDYHFEGTR